MIAIIDYGMGNIHSVNKALQLYGAETVVTNKPEVIESADKAVLPGVGAFDDAKLELEKQGLVKALLKYAKSHRPLLGICLGMQLFFEESEEAKRAKGLGLIKGKVRRFKEAEGIRVPHMGWNQIKVTRTQSHKDTGECPLLKDIQDGAFVYFCHSYYPEPKDISVSAAITDYGAGFTSMVWKDSIYGVQFHPEKSQSVGLAMLKNFVELPC
jgi:imidazole glycerol-phosphate synthase subunit HisH